MKARYVKTQLESIVNISKIVTVRDYEFDNQFVFDGEEHDFWEIVYIDKGQVQVCRDREALTLSQGDIVFHRPNEFHSIRAFNSSPNFFVISFVCSSPAMVYFDGFHTTLDKTLKPFLSSIMSEAKKTFKVPKNNPALKKLEKKENAPLGGEQLVKTYLEQLLILLVRNMLSEGDMGVFPSKESMEMHLVSAAKRIIEEGVEAPFRVNDLCRALGYSKSYLSRLFHEQTGDTIAHFANVAKIKRAKELIREGNLNFAEISERLVFDNPQYFSRVFKRITDMTPTEFKISLNYKRG